MPTVEEVNGVVLDLRQYSMWAWAPDIATLWADLALPVPQTAVIAALGIIYGVIGGGLISSFGLVTGGLLGYAIARRYGRWLVVRLVGNRSLEKVENLFDHGGMWAIVLTSSLPYSIPEAVVLVSGLGRMRVREVFVALILGSVPTAFVFSAIGAGWSEQPALAISLSYFLPILLVPIALYLMHRRPAAHAARLQGQKAFKRELTEMMDMKQTLVMAIRSQFMRPRGFAGWLAGWEMALRSSNRKRNVWAVGLLGVEPTDHVLEIGFGPGIAIWELSRRATQGLVCGVDHSEIMVQQATKRNIDAVRAGRVDLRCGSVEHLPAFKEPFDKVLVVNNMGMWRDPGDRLKDLYRLMRPGGRIAIVSQLRCPGATAETTVAAGGEIVARLTEAGFMCIRSNTLALTPPVVCAIGEVP
ncbi:VTT domain-containing protein [Chroococcidiopsis sp. SAG 2025]|uniref:VTT domain-containing protein n=1 Tax=Chroococcidiopsis sp. SAG 2025 TaxID=171389 RepID=UPI002936DC94|nr:VTT domain-containing protein [Chroococcidiopsis sp. SAG 2025]